MRPDSPTAKTGSDEPKPAVLFVEDDKALREMWHAAFEAEFAVSTAASARDAEFQMHKQEFKVVVSDHLMPGGNGLGFLVRMREEYPRTQRILVTGFMKPEMLLRAVNEAGLLRYFVKPVNVGELGKAIREGVRIADGSAV